MPRRALALKREALTELGAGDLTRVAGAGAAASGLTCPLKDCLNRDFSDDISCHPSCGHSGCCSLETC